MNLKFIWEVVSQIKIGQAGQAFVVDAQGILIAHPDISLVLQKTDLTRLAQVRGALARAPAAGATGPHTPIARNLRNQPVLTAHAPIPALGWTVKKLHLTYQEIETREVADFSKAYTEIVQERSQAVFVQGSPLVFRHLRDIVDLAASHRIPTIFVFREAVPLGGLMSYGVSLADLYKRAATYIDKILHGAKPADLPDVLAKLLARVDLEAQVRLPPSEPTPDM